MKLTKGTVLPLPQSQIIWCKLDNTWWPSIVASCDSNDSVISYRIIGSCSIEKSIEIFNVKLFACPEQKRFIELGRKQKSRQMRKDFEEAWKIAQSMYNETTEVAFKNVELSKGKKKTEVEGTKRRFVDFEAIGKEKQAFIENPDKKGEKQAIIKVPVKKREKQDIIKVPDKKGENQAIIKVPVKKEEKQAFIEVPLRKGDLIDFEDDLPTVKDVWSSPKKKNSCPTDNSMDGNPFLVTSPLAIQKLENGTAVLALYKRDKKYYPAKILEFYPHRDMYRIRFYDDMDQTVRSKDIYTIYDKAFTTVPLGEIENSSDRLQQIESTYKSKVHLRIAQIAEGSLETAKSADFLAGGERRKSLKFSITCKQFNKESEYQLIMELVMATANETKLKNSSDFLLFTTEVLLPEAIEALSCEMKDSDGDWASLLIAKRQSLQWSERRQK